MRDAPITASGRQARTPAEHAEDAFMHAPHRLAAAEPLQRFQTQAVLAERAAHHSTTRATAAGPVVSRTHGQWTAIRPSLAATVGRRGLGAIRGAAGGVRARRRRAPGTTRTAPRTARRSASSSAGTPR